jgi:hypothetical protein
MRTRLAGGVAALLLGATLPANASPVPLPVLRGTVTLTGATSYVREFVLRSPARFSYEHRTVRAAGGRYAGYVLRKVGEGITPTAASIRPGFCTTRGCARPAWSGTYVMDLFTGSPLAQGANPDHVVLSPGRYRVYLVADGKPVTVTLRFPGTGRAAYTSGTRTTAPIAVPEPSSWDPATPAGNPGSLYSAGATHRTTAPLVFHYLTSWKYVYGPPKAAHAQGICTYDGAPAPATLGTYQYPCSGPLGFMAYGQSPTGRKTGPANAFDEHAPTSQFFGLSEVSGELSIGGYINSPVPATSAHTTLLWVDLR